MTDDTPPADRAPRRAPVDPREKRLAEALRANLRRRKAPAAPEPAAPDPASEPAADLEPDTDA